MTNEQPLTARELAKLLSHALQYLEHPHVLEITKTFAMPGTAIIRRIREAITPFNL